MFRLWVAGTTNSSGFVSPIHSTIESIHCPNAKKSTPNPGIAGGTALQVPKSKPAVYAHVTAMATKNNNGLNDRGSMQGSREWRMQEPTVDIITGLINNGKIPNNSNLVKVCCIYVGALQ